MSGKKFNVPKDITFSDAIAYIERYRNANVIPAALAGGIIQALSRNYTSQNDNSIGTITWSVEDFEGRAVDIEANNDTRYDRDRFELALERMISQHDATIGITWDTVDFYLDQYCMIETSEDIKEEEDKEDMDTVTFVTANQLEPVAEVKVAKGKKSKTKK